MLVGITPGAHQAVVALREAQACLRAGRSNEDTLRRADAAGAFSGLGATYLRLETTAGSRVATGRRRRALALRAA
jgi:hypothetical protein